MEEKSSWDSLYPFLFMLIFYVLSQILKKGKDKKAAPPGVQHARPVFRTPSVPISPVKAMQKGVSVRNREPLKKVQPPAPITSSKPRIVSLVESLPSKRNLVLLSEVLNNHCF